MVKFRLETGTFRILTKSLKKMNGYKILGLCELIITVKTSYYENFKNLNRANLRVLLAASRLFEFRKIFCFQRGSLAITKINPPSPFKSKLLCHFRKKSKKQQTPSSKPNFEFAKCFCSILRVKIITKNDG